MLLEFWGWGGLITNSSRVGSNSSVHVLFIETPYDEAFKKYNLNLPNKQLREDMDGEAMQLGVQTRFNMACIRKFLNHHSLTVYTSKFYRTICRTVYRTVHRIVIFQLHHKFLE